MPPFSPQFETTLVHIPIVFFILGFLFKVASLFTLRYFTEELAICFLMLATSGLVSGFLTESNFELQSISVSGRLIARQEMVQIMVLLAAITSAICFFIHTLNFSNFGFKLLGLGLHGMLLCSVFAVAESDRESIANYGNEIASAIPKITQQP